MLWFWVIVDIFSFECLACHRLGNISETLSAGPACLSESSTHHRRLVDENEFPVAGFSSANAGTAVAPVDC